MPYFFINFDISSGTLYRWFCFANANIGTSDVFSVSYSPYVRCVRTSPASCQDISYIYNTLFRVPDVEYDRAFYHKT